MSRYPSPPPSELSPDAPAVDSQSLRLLRLLSLYRCIAAWALAITVAGTNVHSSVYALAFSFSVWALLCYPLLRHYRGATNNLLFVQLLFDLLFLTALLNDAPEGAVSAYALYLLPILAAHGWYLRSRIAFGHAALATCALLLRVAFDQHTDVQEMFLSGVLGAGFFLLTALGLMLGRDAEDSERRAEAHSAHARQLAHINQMVISELTDGVLVVGNQGQILMANPQAGLWLAGDEALMQPDSQLRNWSPELYTRWQQFFTDPTSVEAAPQPIYIHKRPLQPHMQPIDIVEERAGTLILLEDVEQTESQAQQIKLAALGRLSASIAHEIRNPLSAIRQASQLLSEEVPDQPQLRTLTAMVEKNVHRIDRIIRDVSLLGRRDRGSPAALPLQPLLLEISEDLNTSHQIPASAFRFNAPVETVHIWADRGHVEEMLINLLTNAWRHASKSDGCLMLDLVVNEAAQRAQLSIIDDGPGVSESIADRIFEPFFSGSGSTGLGLYLVRELVLANGGNIRLGASNRGARFILELPLSKTPPPAE